MGLSASGLSIARSLGYRDANEASWSQLVQSVERMVDSTELAVLVGQVERRSHDYKRHGTTSHLPLSTSQPAGSSASVTGTTGHGIPQVSDEIEVPCRMI